MKLSICRQWKPDQVWHVNYGVELLDLNLLNGHKLFSSPELYSRCAFVIPSFVILWMSVVRCVLSFDVYCRTSTISTISIIFFSQTTGKIILIFGINSPQVTLLLVSKIHDDIWKNMATKGRGHIYIFHKVTQNYHELIKCCSFIFFLNVLENQDCQVKC